MPYPRLTKCMPDESRYNPFHTLHKALRFGQCGMLSELGAQDFRDDAATGRLLLRLVQQLDLHRVLAEARQEALLGALAARGLEAAAATCHDHVSHLTALAELESLVRAVNVAAPQRRRLAGRSIYRCYALYVAADMTRMDEEETLLLTCLHQTLTDEELRGIEGRTFDLLPPDHLQILIRLLPASLATVELELLLGVLQRHMDPAVYPTAVDQFIRPLMTPGSSSAAA